MNTESLKKSLSNIRYIHERNAPSDVSLITFFEAVLNNKPLEINRAHMESILTNDLNIETKQLSKTLINVLCEALVYYMGAWPSWRQNSGDPDLRLKEKLRRFRHYLIFKANFIMSNAKSFHNESIQLCNKEVQTDNVVIPKVLAPYSIVVSGPPNFINNLVCSGQNGNLVILKHPEKSFEYVDLLQFLNWPNVSVRVTMPDISLTRSSIHQTYRYVSLSDDKIPYPNARDIIHITNLTPGKEFEPYSYSFFFYYFRQLESLLRNISKVHQNRINELLTIFQEFMKDMKEVAVYNTTMSSHASVGFNIGKSRYNRTKKLHGMEETTPINTTKYSEVIIPQVDISLHYFNAVQDCSTRNDVAFKSLNFLQQKLISDPNQHLDHFAILINTSTITYQCIQCCVYFTGPNAYNLAVDHFRHLHKSEQSVVCQRCSTHFTVESLTCSRWSHQCVSS